MSTFEPQTTGIAALKALLKNSLVVRETHKRNKSHVKGPTVSSAKIQRKLRSSHEDLHCELQCFTLKKMSCPLFEKKKKKNNLPSEQVIDKAKVSKY